jgi:hypothetical protein
VLNPISPAFSTSLIDGKSLPWNLVAEATDVIGSQSRQEPVGIKHNRYASAQSTLFATWIARFRTATKVEPLQRAVS